MLSWHCAVVGSEAKAPAVIVVRHRSLWGPPEIQKTSMKCHRGSVRCNRRRMTCVPCRVLKPKRGCAGFHRNRRSFCAPPRPASGSEAYFFR